MFRNAYILTKANMMEMYFKNDNLKKYGRKKAIPCT